MSRKKQSASAHGADRGSVGMWQGSVPCTANSAKRQKTEKNSKKKTMRYSVNSEKENNMVTLETILDWFKESVENKVPISVDQWLDGASKLETLSEDLDDAIAMYEQEMNDKMADYLKRDFPANQSKILARADVDYGDYLKKVALRKRITEFVRIAKRRQNPERI